MLPKDSELRIRGQEIVVAVTVGGPANEKGERLYGTFVRGPDTNHTNAEMTQCLAMLATTMVFGNAAGSKVSLQQSMDEVLMVFKKALEQHVHRAAASGAATRNLHTTQLPRGPQGQAT